jgi:hypothetical protein
MRYALVNDNNVVVNVIEWDGVTPYAPAERIVPCPDDWRIGIGSTYDGSVFTPTIGTAQPSPELAISVDSVHAIADAHVTINDDFLAMPAPVLADVLDQIKSLTEAQSKLIVFMQSLKVLNGDGAPQAQDPIAAPVDPVATTVDPVAADAVNPTERTVP